MFSNKFLLFKIAIAIATITALSYYSQETFNTIYPSFIVCQSMPNKYNDSKIILEAEKVVDAENDHFTVEKDGFTIRVTGGKEIPHKGDVVTLSGRFNKDNFIEADNLIVHKYYLRKRLIIYVVSIAILIVLIVYLSKAFKITLAEGVFVSRKD